MIISWHGVNIQPPWVVKVCKLMHYFSELLGAYPDIQQCHIIWWRSCLRTTAFTSITKDVERHTSNEDCQHEKLSVFYRDTHWTRSRPLPMGWVENSFVDPRKVKSLHGNKRLENVIIGGSKGGARDARPPGGPNSFNFMQFLGKNWPNNSLFYSWRPLLGKILDPPLVIW